jgi:hypothetical protein
MAEAVAEAHGADDRRVATGRPGPLAINRSHLSATLHLLRDPEDGQRLMGDTFRDICDRAERLAAIERQRGGGSADRQLTQGGAAAGATVATGPASTEEAGS